MNSSPSHRNWVNVAAYDQVPAAEALQSYLRSAGIAARIQDERSLQRYWFWTTPQAGIHLQVSGADYAKVRECLETDPAAQTFLRPAIRCPACNSPQVQYPQMTHKFILPTLAAQLMILLRIMKPECYCEDCHHTWVKSTRPLSPLPRAAKIG